MFAIDHLQLHCFYFECTVIWYDLNLQKEFRVNWVKLMVGQFVGLYLYIFFPANSPSRRRSLLFWHHRGGGVCFIDIIMEVESTISTSSWRLTLLIWCHCGSRVCRRWLVLLHYQGGRVSSSDIISGDYSRTEKGKGRKVFFFLWTRNCCWGTGSETQEEEIKV